MNDHLLSMYFYRSFEHNNMYSSSSGCKLKKMNKDQHVQEKHIHLWATSRQLQECWCVLWCCFTYFCCFPSVFSSKAWEIPSFHAFLFLSIKLLTMLSAERRNCILAANNSNYSLTLWLLFGLHDGFFNPMVSMETIGNMGLWR